MQPSDGHKKAMAAARCKIQKIYRQKNLQLFQPSIPAERVEDLLATNSSGIKTFQPEDDDDGDDDEDDEDDGEGR